jgi:hypothetical protein
MNAIILARIGHHFGHGHMTVMGWGITLGAALIIWIIGKLFSK